MVLKETELETSTVTILETEETVAAVYHVAITTSLSAGTTVSPASLDPGYETSPNELEPEIGELGEDDMWGHGVKRTQE